MEDGTTFIIKGRKRALKEAYDRSLNVKYSYYCITGDELVKSYRPFIPLLYNRVFGRGGKSYVITNILDVVIRNAKRLNRLSDEILDVARLESKTLELKKDT